MSAVSKISSLCTPQVSDPLVQVVLLKSNAYFLNLLNWTLLSTLEHAGSQYWETQSFCSIRRQLFTWSTCGQIG